MRLAICLVLMVFAAVVWTMMVSMDDVERPEPGRGEPLTPHVSVAAVDASLPESTARINDSIQVVRDREESGPSKIMIGEVEGTQYWDGDFRTVTYPDGRLFIRGRLRDGKEEGVHESWRPDGTASSSVTWIGGIRNGPAVYYSAAGSVLSRGSYTKGYMEGLWETYYETGQRESAGNYKVGLSKDGSPREQLRVGQWLFWLPDGSVDMGLSGFYEGDKRVRGL